MRNDKLEYVMESMTVGQFEQAANHMLTGCRTRPDKLLKQFHTLLATSDSNNDMRDIKHLMLLTAEALEK